MAKILVVEDERDLASLVQSWLKRDHHLVEMINDGMSALRQLEINRYDVIILDLMLPGMDGLLVCQAMRNDSSTAEVPVIMLTARGEEADRIAGLELGADDYVTKPFSPKELVARVAARLRRTPAGRPTEVVRYGDITIDVDRHVIRAGDADVKLTAKEFLLLRYLVQHRGRVLSRDVLLTDVWGYQYTGGTRTVDVHIRRLREKLPVLNDAIETVKQFGYKLT